MGASKTGSGKTLCYLIAILERLYHEKWTPVDKTGAIVILPTRELAMQVFEVLRSISESHKFSMGLLIGGKDVAEEKRLIGSMNILVCTPGRLLQHMNESYNLDVANLKVLVLDEVDMLLEMGFHNTMTDIISNFPNDK